MKMRREVRRAAKRKGQAIVEFALVFPFFLLIVFGGLVDFGFAFYNFLTLQQMAQDSAKLAAEGNGNQGVSDGLVRDDIFNNRPTWWRGNFLIPPIKTIKSSDGQATVKKVYLVYESPVYTPFYRVLSQATVGKSSIRLAVSAAYQIPNHLY